MKKIFASLSLGLLIISLPTIVSAQDATTGLTNLGALVRVFTTSVVQALAYLALTSAVVAFFFGIVQYIWGIRQGDASKTKVGNNFMVWGLIALFVMFSVWGIITYAQKIIGIQGQTTISIPDIQFKTSGPTSQSPSPIGLPTGISPSPSPTPSPATSCTGKSEGATCVVAGSAGTCTTGDSGVFSCYKNDPAGTPQNPSTSLSSCLYMAGVYGQYVNGACTAPADGSPCTLSTGATGKFYSSTDEGAAACYAN